MNYFNFFLKKISAIIGEVDTDFDSQLDLSSLKAEPLKSLVH